MRQAFSLVELSIVLVILGLLTGGILAGQALSRASELRSVTTQLNRWNIASESFGDKYFAIPGDMLDATRFWGAAHATPATCLTTVGTAPQTCNGDGDSIVDAGTAGSQRGEFFTFWQHLANAGLIEGSYAGMSGSMSPSHATTANVPASRISSGAWFVSYDWPGNAGTFALAAGRHNYRLGGLTTNSWNATPLLAAEELWNIDTKLDDGKPGYGAVTSQMSSYASGCASTSVSSTADYVLTNRGKTCIAYFATVF